MNRMQVCGTSSAQLALALALVAASCTPVLDWRELRPEGAGLAALFPCKPDLHVRRVSLAGAVVDLSLLACAAGGTTYAVAFADIGEPQRAGRALEEMLAAAARNIASTAPVRALPLRVAGMTPYAQAMRQALAGRQFDGAQVQEQVAVFARGARVYQATMVGVRLDDEAVAMFFGALRLST